MSSFRRCGKHGDYFATFPDCPFCEQERTAPPTRPAAAPKVASPSRPPHPAPRKGPSRPSSRRQMPLPSPRVIAPIWRPSKRATLILGSIGLTIAGIVGIFFPIPTVLVLAVVAILMWR